MADLVEEPVCKVDELQINEKKLVPFGGGKIIVVRESEDQFAAVGSVCSHYGAPLINGVVYKGHISCPWHGACFNLRTGDIEEFPGCDSIPAYETYVKNGSLYVKSPQSSIVKKRVKPLTPRSIINRTTYIIIGGGPAGFQCAETLRQEGFDGRVVLISSESVPPYDRTKLSKALTSKVEDILLRNEEYFKKAGIELLLGVQCTKVDVNSQLVYLDDGSNLNYGKLFIATGSSPRKYGSLSGDEKNVFYMRTYKDAANIAEHSKDKNVVLIGSSFIVMEIASYLSGKCKSVSIISKSETPFAGTLGPEIGQHIKNLYLSKKVDFYVTPKVDFVIEEQLIRKVTFEGTELEADVCIIGIGSDPNTQFLADNADIKLSNSFIVVNEKFQTSAEDVYAGGDVVLYPNALFDNALMNIAHWQTAQIHGRFAALAMLDKTTSFTSVPFFWSAAFGKGIRFAGTIHDPKNVYIEGDLEQLSFVAIYYNSKGRAVGVATMANDPVATAFAAALRNGKVITKDDIDSQGFAWLEEIVN